MNSYNCNFDAKNYVRNVLWMSKFTPTTLPGDTNALILAGREWLEKPFLLDKGIPEERIFSCELYEDENYEVEKNKGGSRQIFGGVGSAVDCLIRDKQKMFPDGQPMFSIVNLDYDGSYLTNFLRGDLTSVFRIFPHLSEGYLAITSHSARDEPTIRKGNEALSIFRSGLNGTVTRFKDEIAQARMVHDRLNQLLGSDVEEHTHHSRELGLMWIMTLGLGFPRYEAGGYGYDDISSSERLQLNEVLKAIWKKANTRGSRQFEIAPPDERLYELLCRRSTVLWPTEMWRIAYKSDKGQPMRTWFFRINRLDEADGVTVQDVLQQFWSLVRDEDLLFIDKNGKECTI